MYCGRLLWSANLARKNRDKDCDIGKLVKFLQASMLVKKHENNEIEYIPVYQGKIVKILRDREYCRIDDADRVRRIQAHRSRQSLRKRRKSIDADRVRRIQAHH